MHLAPGRSGSVAANRSVPSDDEHGTPRAVELPSARLNSAVEWPGNVCASRTSKRDENLCTLNSSKSEGGSSLRGASLAGYFLAGVCFTNGVPHLVIAATGRRNLTPFGRDSSAGVSNFASAAGSESDLTFMRVFGTQARSICVHQPLAGCDLKATPCVDVCGTS